MNGLQTYRIEIQGLVQGVGFRPFVYRIAHETGLTGTVENRNDGVVIFLNCSDQTLENFIEKLKRYAPPASRIESINYTVVNHIEFTGFEIVRSSSVSDSVTDVSPDIAVCEDCLADMKVQSNRIGYPFINCTNCGPRFSIIQDLPYDREKTTMKEFEMCPSCKTEYTDVLDRRFHAQPVACEICGPEYTLHEGETTTKGHQQILFRTSELLRNGKIVAVKGIGGFFIACDAFNEDAVARLRVLKNREAKPFALMFSCIDTLKEYAYISKAEELSLCSLKRPIVLLKEKQKIAPSVNVGFDTVGAMLPYMPFHYLLFETSGLKAIVLTSGNISDEPIMTDNDNAINILGNICDAVLTYNRDIHNRTDDSVVRIMNGQERVFRRSRGFAPVPVKTKLQLEGILATGAELVNCFCIGKGNRAIMSQHIGDLQNMETYSFFTESIERHKKLFRFEPKLIVADLHPDYLSTRYAVETGLPVVRVQHHHAHIASCMAEHDLDEPVIGVAMDGTGLGDDGNIWGSEFLVCDYKSYVRKAHFEYIPLPGGDKVTHEPWRTALSMLYGVYGDDVFNLQLPFLKNISRDNIRMLCTAIDKKINTPLSSGAGRVFDAVSAMINLCPVSRFHAEAPMRLESIIDQSVTQAYDFIPDSSISFQPMIRQIVADIGNQTPQSVISARFHNSIVETIVHTVTSISRETGIHTVALSGGSFQNKYLTEQTEIRLQKLGFNVYSQCSIPANDGGIALGQVMIGFNREIR
jgi:hydrogenase maturation protein HypF